MKCRCVFRRAKFFIHYSHHSAVRQVGSIYALVNCGQLPLRECKLLCMITLSKQLGLYYHHHHSLSIPHIIAIIIIVSNPPCLILYSPRMLWFLLLETGSIITVTSLSLTSSKEKWTLHKFTRACNAYERENWRLLYRGDQPASR